MTVSLLGGYPLEQQGEFYNRQTLWITGANKGV